MLKLPGNVKIDQLAFCAWTDEDEAQIKHQLHLEREDWITDTVHAKGEVFGQPGENWAKLQFNYSLGMEVEILRYLDGPNYCRELDLQGGQQCHIGSHYVGQDGVPRLDAPVIQQVVTQSHTNPFLVENNKHYRYTIYNLLPKLGICFKIIERL